MSPADLPAPAAADTSAQPGKHVLWLGFPSYGHIKASLGVVEELLRRGHRVTYVIADRFAAAVGTTGARVVSYASTFPETITGDETATAMLLAFLEESFAPLEATLAAVAADPPQLVVHDVLASDTATAVSRLYRTPTVRVYAGFGTNEHVPQNGTEADPAHTPVDPDDPRLRDLAAALTARVEAAGVAALFADGRTGGDEPAVSLSFVVREFQTKGRPSATTTCSPGPACARWTSRERGSPRPATHPCCWSRSVPPPTATPDSSGAAPRPSPAPPGTS